MATRKNSTAEDQLDAGVSAPPVDPTHRARTFAEAAEEVQTVDGDAGERGYFGATPSDLADAAGDK